MYVNFGLLGAHFDFGRASAGNDPGLLPGNLFASSKFFEHLHFLTDSNSLGVSIRETNCISQQIRFMPAGLHTVRTADRRMAI